MSRNPHTDCTIRTTTAVTMFNGGIKTNVIAPHAKAIINHRIHPLQSVEQVLEFDRKVANDKRIKLNVVAAFEPSHRSPYNESAFGYQLISASIKQVFKQVIVVPATMMANTDTRHYTNITQNIYRFCPTEVTRKDIARYHGNDERILISNYRQTVQFYYHVMLNADELSLEGKHDHSHEL
ncbi:N-fatty-acyl-amino acid synthase/hydrolase PM20D1.2-like [Anneissia japonica]|uniref:N-fatty-acyl-amino acid synthase/hydrolase PM20D1.2-like n=1 Tax=Anneissia japonica TaxID=1529436 RepID=UPI0014255428|nr:N-fatty-acyl-amino acid synthase/hydrolase PM20D1.2-like [Anneissia japonica]